jgi:hypothetical protein
VPYTVVRMRGYDFIGDVHGSGEKLVGLLTLLGYRKVKGHYSNPERQAIFVGDLIDRGPQQFEVLQIVRAMVDGGVAQVVMGNHEFNALAYATPDPDSPGEFCRKHTKKNRGQHQAFLDQLSSDQREGYLRWFMAMPLWLDLGDVRVIHACWHEPSRMLAEKLLRGDRFIGIDQIVEASRRGTELYQVVETLLKGPEIDLRKYNLPAFVDKDGNVRSDTRVRWWAEGTLRARDLAEIPRSATDPSGAPYPEIGPEILVYADDLITMSGGKPVIYGHYWRTWDPSDRGFRKWKPAEVVDWTPTSACVDFSAVRSGPLVAYRWDQGDETISPEKFSAYR